jgi:hypothetical protein
MLGWACTCLRVREGRYIVIPHFHDVFRFSEPPGSIFFKNWIKMYHWILAKKITFFLSFLQLPLIKDGALY